MNTISITQLHSSFMDHCINISLSCLLEDPFNCLKLLTGQCLRAESNNAQHTMVYSCTLSETPFQWGCVSCYNSVLIPLEFQLLFKPAQGQRMNHFVHWTSPSFTVGYHTLSRILDCDILSLISPTHVDTFNLDIWIHVTILLYLSRCGSGETLTKCLNERTSDVHRGPSFPVIDLMGQGKAIYWTWPKIMHRECWCRVHRGRVMI